MSSNYGSIINTWFDIDFKYLKIFWTTLLEIKLRNCLVLNATFLFSHAKEFSNFRFYSKSHSTINPYLTCPKLQGVFEKSAVILEQFWHILNYLNHHYGKLLTVVFIPIIKHFHRRAKYFTDEDKQIRKINPLSSALE